MFKKLAKLLKMEQEQNALGWSDRGCLVDFVSKQLPDSGKAEQEATNELAGDTKLAKTCRDAQQMNKVLQRRITRLMKEKPAIWDQYFKKEAEK